MANDSAEFKAFTKATDEPSPSPSSSPSLIDEVMKHTKETWKDVATGSASTSQYAEAAAEALTVTAVGAFLYTRNRGLADSFARNIDSSLQFTDDVANPALLAQIRASANNGKGTTEALAKTAGKPGTLGLHEIEDLSGLGNEANNPALLAQLKAAGKKSEPLPLDPLNLKSGEVPINLPRTERYYIPRPSEMRAMTKDLPEEINFGDEAANPGLDDLLAAATANKPVSIGHVHGTSVVKFSDTSLNFPKSTGLPPVNPGEAGWQRINSIVKKDLE